MQGPEGREPSADTAADVPQNVRSAFWLLVILLNLSIGALAVGVMLVGFRGQWQTGGFLALVGAAGLGTAYLRYRNTRRQLDAGELGANGPTGSGDDEPVATQERE